VESPNSQHDDSDNDSDGIRNEHADRRAVPDRENRVVFDGQRHSGQLGLVTHFRDKEGNRHRPERVEGEPLVLAGQRFNA
jgi:hypothetical protein